MNNVLKIAGIGFAMALAACTGETAANGNGQNGPVEADTSRNWTEVVTETEEGGFQMGNPDAPIKVIEYASLTCSHCADFAEQSFEPLTEQYISQGTVSFEVRNFVRDPLDLSAALLTRCDGAEPFFQRNERFFANQTAMIEAIQGADQARLQELSSPAAVQSGQAFVGFAEAAGLIEFGSGIGITPDRARQCLTDTAAIERLDEMRSRAVNQHNLQATPTILINGEVAQNVNSWPQLQARLQELVQ